MFTHVCVYACMIMCVFVHLDPHVEIRGQFAGLGFLLPLNRSQVVKPDQPWQWVLLPPELSQKPFVIF